MDIKELKEIYDFYLARLTRLIGYKKNMINKDSLNGTMDTLDYMLRAFLIHCDWTSLPQIEEHTDPADKDICGKISFWDKDYPIYMDDYGQSYYIALSNDDYDCFGTYNEPNSFDACCSIVQHIVNQDRQRLINLLEEKEK